MLPGLLRKKSSCHDCMTMKPAISLLLVACLLVCSTHLSMGSHSKPGLKIRMSNKGLEYASSLAYKAMAHKLKDLRIPNQTGRSKGLDYRITEIQNRGVTIPSSSMKFEPSHNGLSWAIGNFGMNLHANWGVKYKKGWFKVSTSGSVDLKIKRVSISVIVRLGQGGGRPSVSVSACRASVGDVDVYFHGGTAFILNLFRGVVGRKIRDAIQGQVCKLAGKLINEDLNRDLSKIKVHVPIGKRFLLDYSLVSTPLVNVYGLDLHHKGEVFWEANKKEAPFAPPAIAPLSEESQMMYLWVTDYVAATAIHNAQINGYLNYVLKEYDLPSGNRSLLRTTCNTFCVGTIIPLIGMAFPNAKVQISISSPRTPKLSITPAGISISGDANIGLYVVTANGEKQLATFLMDVFLSLKGSVGHERLTGEVTGYRLAIKEIESVFGDNDPNSLNQVLKSALDMGVISSVNGILKKGVDLPVTDIFYFKNTQITFLNGSMLIATDVTEFPPPPKTQPPTKATTMPPTQLPTTEPTTTSTTTTTTTTVAATQFKTSTAQQTEPPTQPQTETPIPTQEQTKTSAQTKPPPQRTTLPQKVIRMQNERAMFCENLMNFCNDNVHFCT